MRKRQSAIGGKLLLGTIQTNSFVFKKRMKGKGKFKLA
jgi:hypothetical protein